MRTAQEGDLVHVHYAVHSQGGSVASSRRRAPLELTVGTDHPRLPGLGSALVGLAVGQSVALSVPPERAHGPHQPARVRRWPRRRLPADATLRPGELLRYTDGRGRRRLVRVLQVSGEVVVVDTNRRWAGQTLELKVELVGILAPGASAGGAAKSPQDGDAWRDTGGEG